MALQTSGHKGAGLTRFDHLSQSMQYEEMLTWLLFYTSLLDVQNNFATFAWFPWVLLVAGSRLPVAGSVVLAMSFYAGEPFLAAIAAVCYVIVNRDLRTIVLTPIKAPK